MSKILLNDRNKRKNHRKFFITLFIFFALIVVLLYITIACSGHWLVQDDNFKHAKWAVILDGQSADLERNDYVANLFSKGQVDSVLILGRRVFRDRSNADFYAEDFMAHENFDSNAVFVVRHNDPSTIEEAQTIIPWLKARKADTVLLVTSPQATRRAALLFSKLSGETPVYQVVNIGEYLFNPDSWIFNRESRKIWLRETAALVNAYYDLWGSSILSKEDYRSLYPIQSLAEEHKSEPVIDLQKILNKEEPQKSVSADSLAPSDTSAKNVSASTAETVSTSP